jgi:hypothetical protein
MIRLPRSVARQLFFDQKPHSRLEKVERIVVVKQNHAATWGNLQFLWATLFARGFASEMSVVKISLGGFIVYDTAKFRRSIIPHRDDGRLSMITVEGSAYAASL